MRRITPRTCLWPITITLLSTFGLSVGLTYQSDHYCFAGVCGEWLFPLQARLHVIIWYSWISISVTFLAIRSFSPWLRGVLHHPLFERRIPLLGKHLAVSGVLIICWVMALYGTVIGIWWIRLNQYFSERGYQDDVTQGNSRLAAIALTGHLADITLGATLLPISRHSALASLFKLSVSTTLTFHMLAAYVLFTLVLIHGFLYVAWIPVFDSLSTVQRQVFPVLNPTYLYHEVWPGSQTSLGIWRASLVFTGLATTVIMLLIFITTIPGIRRHHFNAFYFTHLLVIVAVVIICLHASTMFYCTAPGIILWSLDWCFRLFELKREVSGTVASLGNGYYTLSMPMSRIRLKGCNCNSPLAHFYIYHAESSIRELHPFTTITHLASANVYTSDTENDINIQFLFRKRSNSLAPKNETTHTTTDSNLLGATQRFGSKPRKPKAQWTEKIASQADRADSLRLTRTNSVISIGLAQGDTNELEAGQSDNGEVGAEIRLRFEGPYFTAAEPARYHTVVCLVAGTGVSGGIAIASAFVEMQRQRSMGDVSEDGCTAKPGAVCMANLAGGLWQRCVVVWTVRGNDYVDLPFFQDNKPRGLEFRPQLTGAGLPRMDMLATLAEIKKPNPEAPLWVYLSGPNSFITAGEVACKAAGVDFYGARWEI